MQAIITPLHHSGLGRVLDFKCQCGCDERSAPEYTRKLTISFTRRGNFGYSLGRREYEVHSGMVLLEKADCEYRVAHRCAIKDECTIFEFEQGALEEMPELWKKSVATFFARAPAALIAATPRLEALHAAALHAAQNAHAGARLKIDELLLDLLQDLNMPRVAPSPAFLTQIFLERQRDALDQAKHFILANFQHDLSLPEIARHGHLSVFHFSRLFKQLTQRSPYQFLRDVRLQHAQLLLTHTSLPVTQICFESGYNSLEHFILSFTKQFGLSPSKYRKRR